MKSALLIVFVLFSIGGAAQDEATWTETEWKQVLAAFQGTDRDASRKAEGKMARHGMAKSFLDALPRLLTNPKILDNVLNMTEHGELRLGEVIPPETLKLLGKDENSTTAVLNLLRRVEENDRARVFPPVALEKVIATALDEKISQNNLKRAGQLYSELFAKDWERIGFLLNSPQKNAKALAGHVLRKHEPWPPDIRARVATLLGDPELSPYLTSTLKTFRPFAPDVWREVAKLTQSENSHVRRNAIQEIQQEANWQEQLKNAGGHVYTMKEYVEDCENDGVEIPSRLNCMEGEEVPVYKTVCEGNKKKKTRITKENYEQMRPDKYERVSCDNPAHLSSVPNGCIPGARIQVIKSATENSFCTLMCRKHDNGEPEKFFSDINMICHNPENGNTCFFNSKVKQSVDGSLLHKPGSAQDAKWMDIQIYDDLFNCYQCHSNDPIVTSPYLADIKSISRENTGRKLNGPYYISGKQSPMSTSKWQKRYFLKDKGAAMCTECHRIGSHQASCDLIREMSDEHPPEHDSKSKCFGETYPYMPPKENVSDANREEYKKALQRTLECCEKGPQDPSCEWELQPEKPKVSTSTDGKSPENH